MSGETLKAMTKPTGEGPSRETGFYWVRLNDWAAGENGRGAPAWMIGRWNDTDKSWTLCVPSQAPYNEDFLIRMCDMKVGEHIREPLEALLCGCQDHAHGCAHGYNGGKQ